jgi:hypothetical protein
LKNGGRRLIMIGNHKIEASMFSLNHRFDKTLYHRLMIAMKNTHVLHSSIGNIGNVVQNVVFVDISEGEEKDFKESFINETEANAVIDYLISFEGIELSTLAIMSPFRT